MNCPYCGADTNECLPDVLYINCEDYGSKLYYVACQKCDNVLEVYAVRTVQIKAICKSDKSRDETDW